MKEGKEKIKLKLKRHAQGALNFSFIPSTHLCLTETTDRTQEPNTIGSIHAETEEKKEERRQRGRKRASKENN